MQANLLFRRIRQTCEPVKAAIAGTVTWHKESGNPIQQYDTLATLRSDTDAIAITAPHTGTLRTLMIPESEIVEQGAILCYIEPAEPLPPTGQVPTTKGLPKRTDGSSNGHRNGKAELRGIASGSGQAPSSPTWARRDANPEVEA